MSGGGSKSTPQTVTQTTSTTPWSGQQPYLTDVFQQAQQQYQSNQPQYFPGQTVVPFSPETNTALTGIENRATSGSPLQTAGSNEQLATIQGNYLDPNSNSGFQGALNAALQPITTNYLNNVIPGVNSQFAAAGRFSP